jgi:hypothetical protein
VVDSEWVRLRGCLCCRCGGWPLLLPELLLLLYLQGSTLILSECDLIGKGGGGGGGRLSAEATSLRSSPRSGVCSFMHSGLLSVGSGLQLKRLYCLPIWSFGGDAALSLLRPPRDKVGRGKCSSLDDAEATCETAIISSGRSRS